MKAGIASQGKPLGSLAILCALLLSAAGGVGAVQNASPRPHRGFRASTQVNAGLDVVTFKTPQGAILLDLPADLQAGDSIIGTVALQSKEQADKTHSSNGILLSMYTLSVGDQTKLLSEAAPTWKLTVPAEEQALSVVLKDAQGIEVARVALPVPDVAPAAQQNEPTSAARLRFPPKGQAGRPLLLRGAVRGELTNLQVRIGGIEAPLLAASPRSIIVMSPTNVLGKTQLEMKQGDMLLYQGDYRNERVRRHINPWPYIIAGVVIVIIDIVVEANRKLHQINDGLQNLKNFPF